MFVKILSKADVMMTKEVVRFVFDLISFSGIDVQRLCDTAYENKSDQFRC